MKRNTFTAVQTVTRSLKTVLSQVDDVDQK